MFEVKIHDNPQFFRLVLEGELEGRWVRELELCWRTGASTLGARQLEVDLSALRSADEDGRDLLARMCRAGACFLASTSTGKALLEDLTCRAHVLLTPAPPRRRLWHRVFGKFLTTGFRERASTTVMRGQDR